MTVKPLIIEDAFTCHPVRSCETEDDLSFDAVIEVSRLKELFAELKKRRIVVHRFKENPLVSIDIYKAEDIEELFGPLVQK